MKVVETNEMLVDQLKHCARVAERWPTSKICQFIGKFVGDSDYGTSTTEFKMRTVIDDCASDAVIMHAPTFACKRVVAC